MNLESMPQGVVAGSIPLFAGHPSPDLLPIDDLQRIILSAWDAPNVARFLNYGDEQGNRQLIEFLVERLNRAEDLGVSRDNLMIIGGSTWGVGMVTQHLTAPGDAVLVDAPSYRDALHIFRDHRLKIRAAPIDDEGIIVADLERSLRKLAAAGAAARFYYVVPNFQNPSGITMSRERRLAVIELSRQYNFAIVEDDVYSDLRFEGAAPPSFYDLAGGENVLRLGTFSKTLAPGLRIGWLIASPDRIAGFVESGMLRMGGGANPFTAAVVADYCRSGAWEAHVQWLRGQYERRRDTALAALETSMPAGVTWTRPRGGYFIWLRLPSSAHVDALEERARGQGVYFASGKGFYVDPADGTRQLRLSFSFVPLLDLRSGIEVLGELIARMAA
ncbi:MAG: PLP-dependent aminotransferase family protein [Chloroflexota bacterium]|nr:PLP-dependent aminotransferase family protein [Chloroflexota bacterium]